MFTTKRKFLEFLRYFGPAWIVMIADLDAASIITAAQTGVSYKYSLIWFLAVLTIPLFFIQEVSGRIGAITSKGLGEIIREVYSKKTAIIMTVPMVVTDVLSYAAEYAGIAIGLMLFGIPIIIGLPIVFIVHILLVYKRRYISVERILMIISLVLILSFIASFLKVGIKPYPLLPPISDTTDYVFLLAANAGAVVMPFMLFYQASATAEKGNEPLWVSRLETLIGAIVTEILMIIIEIVSSPLPDSVDFLSPKSLSEVLNSVLGSYSTYIFGLGLISAAFLALVVISLASSWGLMEAIGLKREKGFIVYTLESLPGLILPFIYSESLINYILNLMVIFVFVLIGPAIIMGVIAQNKHVMGEHALKGWWRIAYWSSVVFVIFFGFLSLL